MYYLGDDELIALKTLFERRRLYRYQSTYVSECDQFEKEFSDHVGCQYSLLLNSGTNALFCALMAADIQPGDEVLVPSYTFVATAAAVVQAGAIPIIVNVDEELSLDFEDAKNKVGEKTKAVILVHMDGLCANIEAAKQFCSSHQLVLIEDVAQAIGGSYRGRHLGTHGNFGCYSLNENKNISCGEGGIFITNSRKAYETAYCLHDTPSQFSPSKKDFYKEIKPFLGFSMRISEIQGAIMRVQLGRLDLILNELRQRKNIFLEAIQEVKSVKVIRGYCAEGDCASSIHLQFGDPFSAADISRSLREIGALFAPVTVRPAHASWKWSHLLAAKFKDQAYDNSEQAKSLEILSRTTKLEINHELSLEETSVLANKICGVLKNGL